MKVNGNVTTNMEKDIKSFLMDACMKDITSMENQKGWEDIPGQTDNFMKENG